MILTVRPDENGKTLDELLRGRGISRRLITRLKRIENGLTRDGALIRTVDRVYNGDKVELRETERERRQEEPGVPVLYEDEHCMVFDKPPFMPCHQSMKHYDDTLANEFFKAYPELPFRSINRLDRNTSGCAAAAKSSLAAYSLQRSIKKVYVGIMPRIGSAGGRICAPIARERESAILRCVREDGAYAATTFYKLADSGDLSLCAFIPETGRTHQIRVHCAHIGKPLIGDELYGGDMSLINRHALHCARVEFIKPLSDERICVYSQLPEDMVRAFGKNINVKSL